MPYKNPYGARGTRTKVTVIRLGVGGRSEISDLSTWIEDLQKSIRKAKANLKDMTPIWKAASAIIINDINNTFEQEGKNLSSDDQWPPLNKSYAKRKQKEVGDRKMLTWSGVMKASIRVERKTQSTLKISARDPKARFHEFGLKPPGAQYPLPRRPFMILTSGAQDAIMSMIDKMVADSLSGRRVSFAVRRSQDQQFPQFPASRIG